MRTPNQCLRQAIERGDRAKILMILNSQNANLKAIDIEGNTILHNVLKNKHLVEGRMFKILKIFLSRGVDPNIGNRKKESVLCLAIQKRMMGVINLLVKYNATIGSRESHFITQTFIDNESREFWKCTGVDDESSMRNREFMESKNASFFEFLLSNKLCVIDIINVFGVRAGRQILSESIVCNLHSAVRKDLLHIVPVWLKYTKSKDFLEDDKTLLHTLFQTNKKRSNSDIDPNWYADYRRRYVPGIVKTLLDRGVSALAMDKQGMTPLRAAVENEKDFGIIELLVNHVPNGCDESIWATGQFCEIISARWSDLKVELYQELLDGLIAKGADFHNEDECGRRPVQRAVSARNLHAGKYLRGKGVDLGVLTKDGDSLLHVLARKDGSQVGSDESEEMLLDWLISEGWQVDVTNPAGNSPLHVAATCGNLTFARKLVYRGAIVNARNNEMQIPLHCSTRNKEAIDVAEFLINAGARVNSRDIQGFTPLHLAATVPRRIDNMNMLKLLLSRGAYPDTRDNEGDSVLAKTIRHDHHAYARELIEHGANLNSLYILTRVAEKRREFFYVWISRHYLKMQFARLPCLDDYRKVFQFQESELQEFHQACLKEIETLKDTPIDSRTSLYQFLHMGPNSRCIHINNEKLKDLVNPSKIEKQFPEYASIILASYSEIVTRKVLLKPAKKAWLKLTNIVLPDICVERILSYLNNDDMVIIIDEE